MQGFSSFREALRGRRVVVWSDNTCAESSVAKGRARSFDHNALVHVLWSRAAALGMEVWVERVPTECNIADDPSRERYDLLHELGAVWASLLAEVAGSSSHAGFCRKAEAKLDDVFRRPQAWESLSLRHVRMSRKRP